MVHDRANRIPVYGPALEVLQKKLRLYVEQAKNRFLSQFEDVTEKQSGRNSGRLVTL